MTRRVAIATCTAFAELEDDDRLLLDALRARGADAHPQIWDDPSTDWASFDVVLLRATWDYSDRLSEFLAWCERVSAVTRLENPLELVRWNTDKHYLGELADAGIATVPTTFVEPGDDLRSWQPPSECATFVVKPTVSAGSRDTMRHANDASGHEAARAHIAGLLEQGRAVIVQPYLDSVDEVGETAQMFIAGQYSHAIRKGQMLEIGVEGERVGGLYLKEPITSREPTPDERAVAERIADAIPGGRPLYARIDLIRMPDGSPVLLELEVTEPSLFFLHAPTAAERMADEILRD